MKFKIGQKTEISRTITFKDVENFADIIGDHNPIHLDEKYARNTLFGRRIVHGMFGASLLSSIISLELPGPGAIYLKQSLNFKRPVFIDDTIKAMVRIIALEEKKDKIFLTLETICTKDNGDVVIDGQAVVLVNNLL